MVMSFGQGHTPVSAPRWILIRIYSELKPNALQTYRMAGAIVANAMVFHERLAGLHGVKPLSLLTSTSIENRKGNILDA